MPVSPSCLSWISACHFRTFWSLDGLWIFQIGPATFKYSRAIQSKTTKNPSLQILFFNPASQPPLFLLPSCSTYLTMHLTDWKLKSITLEPKILSEKGDFPEHFARTFSLVMPFSHESEHTKLMTLLIINLPLAVFYWQSLSCKVIDKSQGDLNSSNSNYFPLCPPLSISIALLFFQVSTSIFCVLIC